MKKLMYLLLIAFSLFCLIGCTEEVVILDDDSEVIFTSNSTNKVKLVISASESLREVHVAIRDINAVAPIRTIHYYALKDLTLEITEGNNLIITSGDNNPINCQYTFYNKDNTVQWQETIETGITAVLEKRYIIK